MPSLGIGKSCSTKWNLCGIMYFPVDNSTNVKPFEKTEPLPMPDICVDIFVFILSNISVFSFSIDISAPVSINKVSGLPVFSFVTFIKILKLRFIVYILLFNCSEYLKDSVRFPNYFGQLGHYCCYLSFGVGNYLGWNYSYFGYYLYHLYNCFCNCCNYC